MSSTQINGKKTGSGSNSTVNTPASTPVTSIANIQNGQTATQTSPPPNNNAPKYGTLVPNRIFVGGISASTTESELHQLFSNYGTVKAAKIIQDRAGVSKGYGFITFESEDDAKRLQREADNIVLRERKLNIAPAIKKQPFSRGYEASSPTTVPAGNAPQYFFQTGVPYFQGGMAYYPTPTAAAADPTTQQPAAVYQPAPSVYPAQSGPPQTATFPPVMFSPQPVYVPQQFTMPMPQYDYNYYTNGGSQYIMGNQGGPQSQVPPMQRPNSPPRPPCYGQQLSYNPETMYYSVYTPMEGPTVYSDTMDIANGTIAEESYQLGEFIPQELESRLLHKTDVQLEPSTTIIHTTANSSNTNVHQTDTSRQSNTPVVSLLSIDHQQEKDLTSMQSGRRRKSPSQTPRASTPHNHNFMPNGFQSGYTPVVSTQSHNPNPYSQQQHHHHHHQQQPHPHHSQHHLHNTYPPHSMYLTHVQSLAHQQHHHHNTEYGGYNNPNVPLYNKIPNNSNPNNNRMMMMNGHDKFYNNNNNNIIIRKKRTYTNDRSSSSSSSYKQHQYNSNNNNNSDNVVTVRSDSNSSASVIDENRNENKTISSIDHSHHHHVTASSTIVSSPSIYSTSSNNNKVSNNYYNHNSNNIVRYNNWSTYNNNNIRSGGFNNQDKRVNVNKTFVHRKIYNNNNNNSSSNNNNNNASHKEQKTTTIDTQQHNNYVYNNKNNLFNIHNKSNNNVVPVNCEISSSSAATTTTTNCIDLVKTITHQNVPVSQIPASSQHFAPPSRRNRKTVRRNNNNNINSNNNNNNNNNTSMTTTTTTTTISSPSTTSTTAISEIGAGDAPLPVVVVPQEVNDTGKKLESLKL